MGQWSRHVTRGSAVLVAVVLLAGGCSGDKDDPPEKPSATASATSPAAVTTQVSWGSFAGRLPQARRDHVAADVQKVVDGWLDAAYVAGDYPRTDFAGSWPGFTPGAQALARRDADLTSNSDIGASIDGVVPEKRALRLDVISVRKLPIGVTARVVLRFATTGDTVKHVRVAGRLYLTRSKQGWQVFGYDLTKGDAL
jgi:hypothetical protein